MSAFIPREVGSYRFLERLGTGAFASVYRGERLDRPGHLALKVLNPHVARGNRQHVLALREEARLLRAVDSRHVVGVHACEVVQGPEGDDWHILALDYVQGVTLADLGRLAAAMPGRIPLGAVVRVADDVLAGLEAAHDARDESGPLGVVHRDLKPHNVMVDEAGVTRVLDLGIAWAKDRTVRTEVGLTKGTPPWMSPEQIQGKRIDARSDLYVLGVLLFDLLSAEPWCALRGPGRSDEVVMLDCLQLRFDDRRATLLTDIGARYSGARDAAALVSLVGALLEPVPRDRPARAGIARNLLRPALPNEVKSRALLGRMARGIRLAREAEARPEPDVDATQLVAT